jgi:multiple sugar transport system permease protein
MYEAVLDLSARADNTLAAVAVRFQADDSWHGIGFEVEHNDRRYESTDLLSLNGDRWVEWAFELKPSGSDQRELGIWPTRSRLSNAAPTEKALLRVTVHRRTPLVATLCKWTQSYRDAWYADPLWPRYLFNSILLVVLNILGQVIACSLAAFAFSRLRWAGRDLVFAAVVSTMMLPGIVMLIPQFLIFRSLGWYNTLLPLWVPALAGAPFFIFIIRQFMMGMPRELDEAARIDGCSWFGVYLRVILPLSKPSLAAVAVFTFMASWNEFMGPLIYLSDARLYPLPMGLYSFRTDYETRFNMLMAASTIMVIPAIAIFFCAQRYFIQGASFAGVNR